MNDRCVSLSDAFLYASKGMRIVVVSKTQQHNDAARDWVFSQAGCNKYIHSGRHEISNLRFASDGSIQFVLADKAEQMVRGLEYHYYNGVYVEAVIARVRLPLVEHKLNA